VGTTGHRPNRLREADLGLLRERVREMLRLLRATFRDLTGERGATRLLRVLSALAEGSDRIVAQEAIPLGFQLEGILPFRQEEYERDFESTESRAEFHDLLSRAAEVLELAGSRQNRETRQAAYSAAGRSLLEKSRVLLAVWDGRRGRGKGGTAEVIADALGRRIPTIWISSIPPHGAQLLGAAGEEGPGPLSEKVRRALTPPRRAPP
jgi:hypothetical protein